jgi:hypothetical protein
MTSLFFCKKTQAAAFLRMSSGNVTSSRHNGEKRYSAHRNDDTDTTGQETDPYGNDSTRQNSYDKVQMKPDAIAPTIS